MDMHPVIQAIIEEECGDKALSQRIIDRVAGITSEQLEVLDPDRQGYVRKTFEFTAPAYDRMQEMRQQLQMKKVADVIREGLLRLDRDLRLEKPSSKPPIH